MEKLQNVEFFKIQFDKICDHNDISPSTIPVLASPYLHRTSVREAMA